MLAAIAPPPRRADLLAERADLERQRPALVARARQTEQTADAATGALWEARRHYDRCVLLARDARQWADNAADALRAHDRALAAVAADLAALPAPGDCQTIPSNSRLPEAG